MKIDSLVSSDILFPYSPSHVEEIEFFRVCGSAISINWCDQLDLLRDLSKEKCFICSSKFPREGDVFFYDLGLCYENVTNPRNYSETMRMLSEEFDENKNVPNKIDFYQGVIKKIVAQLDEPLEMPCDLKKMGEGQIQTFIAILNERHRIEKNIKFLKSNEPCKEKLDKIRNLDPREVFGEENVIDLLILMNEKERILEVDDWDLHEDHKVFYARQRTLVNLFNFLNSIGYSAEHSKLRSKNRLFDTSHALYASYADVFVTNDKKLKKQTQAIFSFLGHNTQVMNQDEFIKFY